MIDLRFLLALTLSIFVWGNATPSHAEDNRGGSLSQRRIDAFLQDSMQSGGLNAWIILTREGNADPISKDFGFDDLGRAALIFLDDGDEGIRRLAVVSSLDLVPLRQSGIYERLVGVERDESFEDKLAGVLRSTLEGREIYRIGVNMSDAHGLADGLTASSLELLKRALGPRWSERLVPAETTILSFRAKRLPEEVEIVRGAARTTAEILHQAFTDGFLVPGTTTQAQMAEHVRGLASKRGFDELAWNEGGCPGVYSGLFTDLSHAEPGERVIEPGDILWIDFGIRDQGYATDVIRAGYLLRPGEIEPPVEVQRMFDTALAANRAATQAMKPGIYGWQVDQAAREVVIEAGYPEFFHATGHPVGFVAHGAGPSLGPKSPRYGRAVELPLEENQIFAVEPSVMLPREELGGSWIINVEEEVLVTPEGGVYLSPPQESLYLIPPPADGESDKVGSDRIKSRSGFQGVG